MSLSESIVDMAGRAAAGVRAGRSVEFMDWLFERPAYYRGLGVDVLPLLGSPRRDPAPHVLEATLGAARNLHIDNRGTPDLRHAITDKLAVENRIEVDPDTEVLVTNGALNAVFLSLVSILDRGEEVIIPCPQFYHWHAVQLAGGVPKLVPSSEQEDWCFDLRAISEAITPRTKAIVITSPVNPTGHVPSTRELEALGEMAQRHGLFILEDQSYEKFIYDDAQFVSIASIPGLKTHALIIYSFHKNYSMHAWRLGFVAGPAAVMSALHYVSAWTNLRVNYNSQVAGAAALRGPQEWVRELVKVFADGRDAILKGLAGDPGLSVTVPAQGCTMGFLNVGGLGRPSTEVSELLLANYGVPTAPGSLFGPARASAEQVRIPFHLEDDSRHFSEVIARLKRASVELRQPS